MLQLLATFVTLVSVRATTYRDNTCLTTIETVQIVPRIKKSGLKIALENTKVLPLHDPRNTLPTGSYIMSLIQKVIKTTAALAKIMLNLGGSNITILTRKTVALLRKS
ncbi:hypothetical protein EVAR_97919_1 [Eumeta japonica]|uniref:Uncharacterized protein n=1 Tax=Eumeta variegata TaxID=151549 RepID=A0A4C1XTT5_EUMVA|nr:hypothetical protein EVAR_97919_1 [Eumeta japonica]